MSKDKIYIAYGSNMNFTQMKRRCPKARLIGQGILRDYKLTFRSNGAGHKNGVANIESSLGDYVPVLIWLITERCERSLDIYEGYPMLYTKKEVEVQPTMISIFESYSPKGLNTDTKSIIAYVRNSSENNLINGMAYVMTEKFAGVSSIPSDRYYSTIEDAYEKNDFDTDILQTAYDDAFSDFKDVMLSIGSPLEA